MYRGTKRQLAQSILGQYEKWAPKSDTQIDIRDIYVILDRVANKYVRKSLTENMSDGDRQVGDSFIRAFNNVPIYYDADRDLCYSVLPSRFVDLPNGKGIDMVAPMQNIGKAFYPVSRHHLSSFRNSPLMNKWYGFWEENDGYEQRLYYSKKFDGTGITEVLVRLVIPGMEAVSEDAAYPIDPGMESDIVDEVLARLVGNDRRAQDKLTDGRSDR